MDRAIIEGPHPFEFLVSEGSNFRSREVLTILSGEGVIEPGQLLGKVGGDSGTVTVGNPAFVGSGGGALTKATPAYGSGVKEGTYRVICIEPASAGGTFAVEDPDGIQVGIATVGAAFDGVVKFTIADGTPDFAAGDTFTLAVSIADAASAGKYRSADPTNTDGSGVAVAVALYGVDATSADAEVTCIVRDAIVRAGNLVYDAAVDDAPKKATKQAELTAAGILVR